MMTEKRPDSSIPRWILISGWILGTLLVPFIVARYTTTNAIERERTEQIRTAKEYAAKLEKYLNLQLSRRWEDFDQDSIRIESQRSDSLRRIDGDLSRRGLLGSGARSSSYKRANEHFDYILKKSRWEVERFAEDIELQVESIRETGVILKLE